MTIMGVDFGTRRIGIAVSSSGVLATPLAVLANEGDIDGVFRRIGQLAEEHGVERIVLGNPARPGDDAAQTRFLALAETLGRATGCQIVLWDEAYSTTEAASLRRERGMRDGPRRRPIDDEAAAVILQSYIDATARETSA